MAVNAAMRQRFLVLGFLVVLLVAIPVTIYVVKINTKGAVSKAAPSTVLSMTTTSTQITPGSTVPVSVIADPGTNAISVIQLSISYDATKLSTDSGGLVPNTAAFPTLLNPVTYGPCTGNFCTITATLAIGADPTKAITTKTTIATLSLTALAPTDQSPTNVSFGSDTTVYSVGSGDQASENVLSSTQPLALTIGTGTSVTGTLTPTPTLGGSTTVTDTPTPTNTTANSGTPTPTPDASATSSATQAPTCANLTADQTTASPGATLNFTANGNSSSGVITKVTFNFGDSGIQDVTDGGGIGTNTVSVQQAHTYTTSGTFTAVALLTDDSNNVSDSTNCQLTITIGTNVATNTPIPTLSGLPLTGPGDTYVGIGIGGIIVAVIGGLLFFAL